jgi:hypothetical protein
VVSFEEASWVSGVTTICRIFNDVLRARREGGGQKRGHACDDGVGLP